jgi:hypothetical protein
MQRNILFLDRHNSGRFIEPYGHAVPTPNLMRLAHQGAPSYSPSGGARIGRGTKSCPLPVQVPVQDMALGRRYQASPRPAPEPKREPQPPFSGT